MIQPELEEIDSGGRGGKQSGLYETNLLSNGYPFFFRVFSFQRCFSVSEFERFALACVGDLFGEYGDRREKGRGSLWFRRRTRLMRRSFPKRKLPHAPVA